MKMNIEVDEEGFVTILQTNSNGTIAPVVCTFESLVQAFQHSTQSIDLEMFPRPMIKYKSFDNTILVALEYPAMTIPKMSHYNSVYTDMAVPASVWVVAMSRSSISSPYYIKKTMVFALSSFGMLSESVTKLYYWPFPNYADTYQSGVCWGSDENFRAVSDDVKLANLGSLYNIYFSASGNNDLSLKVSGELLSDLEDSNHTCFLSHISRDKVFNEAALLENDSYPTLNSVFESLSRSIN